MTTLSVAFLALPTPACSGDSGDGTVPAIDASPSQIDASEATAGLTIKIEAQPERGEFEGDFDPVLTSVAIEVSDFRVIGDAAPGDDRTRIASLTLTFSEDDQQTVRFESAPVGKYSRIRARIDRFFLSGSQTVDESDGDWEIETEPGPGYDIDLSIPSVLLAPGANVTIELEARLDRAYDKVDWGELAAGVGNTRRVDDEYEKLEELAEEIEKLFSVEDDDDKDNDRDNHKGDSDES